VRALFLLLILGCSTEPEPIELRVATINLRHDVDWWEDRFQLISAQLAELEADLIGMQEVKISSEQAELLHLRAGEAGLSYEFHQELKTQLAAITGEGIALFSNRGFAAKTAIDLEYGRPAIIDRIALGDRELTFVNMHLHHQGGDEVRLPQMQEALAAIEGASPVIMTGDFNATPDSQTYAAAIAAGFVDAGIDAGNTSPIRLVRSATVAQAPRNRIDYIMVRGLEVLEARIAFDRAGADGLYPSDHLGVFARVRFN
jgi:endonuclease/exonuclease/phosphatase family metal-dependent hydrolase